MHRMRMEKYLQLIARMNDFPFLYYFVSISHAVAAVLNEKQ